MFGLETDNDVGIFSYCRLYIFVTDEATATLRSGSYLTGIGIIFTLFIKAGLRIA